MKIILMNVLVFFAFVCDADVVKIATEGSYPPWSSIDEKTGDLIGYDVDVATAICEKANLECEIYKHDFSSIISSIRFKKYDAIIASLTDNEDRRRVIDFSTRYAKVSSQFISIPGRSDAVRFCFDCPSGLDMSLPSHEKKFLDAINATFIGMKIGVQKNTVSYKYLNDDIELDENIKIVVYKTMKEVMAGVVSGEVDGALGDTSFFIDVMKQDSSLPLVRVGPEVVGKSFGRGIAVGLRKEDKALAGKINTAISEVIKDGTLQLLSLKWFEYDISP